MASTEAASRVRVAVIGAGVGGLSAARELQRVAGRRLEVVVFEARDRIGGRISSRTLGDGTVVDLGAFLLHGKDRSNPLTGLAAEIGAAVLEVDEDKSRSFEAADGAGPCPELSDDELDEAERLFEQTKSLFKQRQRSAQAAGDALELGPGVRALRSKRFAWEKLTERQALLLSHFWRCVTETDNALDFDALSFAWWDTDDECGGPHCLWPQGYRAVPEHLAQGLDIRLGSCVTGVRAADQSSVASGGPAVRLELSSGATEAFDFCVVSLPLGVLRSGRVHFEPALPAHKVEAIGRLGMAHMNKVALRFSECFWDCETVYFNRVPLTPELARPEALETPFILNMKPFTGSNTVVAYFCASTASFAELLGHDALCQHAERLFRALFPGEAQAAARLLEAVSTAWDGDEYALGAYSAIKAGATPADYDILAESVAGGRLLFCGEATNRRYPATVHGALLSGTRAAKELLKSMKA